MVSSVIRISNNFGIKVSIRINPKSGHKSEKNVFSAESPGVFALLSKIHPSNRKELPNLRSITDFTEFLQFCRLS
jgi:hypothetical protein